jgi:hypothetical protein
MKKIKSMVSSLAIASMVMGAAVPTMAATKLEYRPTVVSTYTTAKVVFDNYAYDDTTWVPLYYLLETLGKIGMNGRWNGANHTIYLTDPQLVGMTLPSNLGNAQVYLNGSLTPFGVNFMQEPDPQNHGRITTYMKLTDFMQILSVFQVKNAWNGAAKPTLWTISNAPHPIVINEVQAGAPFYTDSIGTFQMFLVHGGILDPASVGDTVHTFANVENFNLFYQNESLKSFYIQHPNDYFFYGVSNGEVQNFDTVPFSVNPTIVTTYDAQNEPNGFYAYGQKNIYFQLGGFTQMTRYRIPSSGNIVSLSQVSGVPANLQSLPQFGSYTNDSQIVEVTDSQGNIFYLTPNLNLIYEQHSSAY